MKPLAFVRGDDLDRALQREDRQYLAGHLMREQKHLAHVDADTEVGVSDYRHFTPNKPHVHPVATEFGYVLRGSVRVRLLDGSGEENQFDAGDFFVIAPGVPYASKNAPGTRVLFVKAPGGNDKTLVPVDEDTERWLAGWD